MSAPAPRSVLLLLMSLCLDTRTAGADPLVSEFRAFLDDVLDDLNADGWSLSYNLSGYETELSVNTGGWMSLRGGRLHNLSSWSRPHDSVVSCGDRYSSITANITFEPLSFSYSYFIDSGYSLSPTRALTGNLTGLSAQLEVAVDTDNLTSAQATFQLLYSGNVSLDEPAEGQTLGEDETIALGRALKEDVLPQLQLQIMNTLDDVLSEESLHPSSLPCGSTDKTTSGWLTSPAASTRTTRPTLTDRTTSTTGATTVSVTSKYTEPVEQSAEETKAPVGHYRDFASYQNQGNLRKHSFHSTTETEKLNKFIDLLLQNAGTKFHSLGLQPYRMPNSEEELHQESGDPATMSGKVSGTGALVLSADPDVTRRNRSVTVTAGVGITDISYDFTFMINSELPAEIRGKVTNLTGLMAIDANVKNPSAAIITLKSFETMPTMSLVSTVWVSDNTTEGLELETSDAVMRVFKKNITSLLQGTITPLLRKSVEGKKMNVSEALTATTAAPTTTVTAEATADVSTAGTTTVATVSRTSSTEAIAVTSTAAATPSSVSGPPAGDTDAGSSIATTPASPVVASSDSSDAAQTVSSTAPADPLLSSSPSTQPGSSATGTEPPDNPGSASSFDISKAWIFILVFHVALLLSGSEIVL